MSARWRASWLVAMALAGCHSAGLSSVCAGDPVCACGPGIDTPPIEGRTHVPEGSTVDYVNNPPSSGNHYPVWHTPWGPSATPIRREYWVHNLEHGGIVLLYNCPSGCQPLVDQLIALYHGTPPDRFNEVRFLITPDSAMPHTLAALAWGYRWQGDALDLPTLKCFISDRYDKGPESIP